MACCSRGKSTTRTRIAGSCTLRRCCARAAVDGIADFSGPLRDFSFSRRLDSHDTKVEVLKALRRFLAWDGFRTLVTFGLWCWAIPVRSGWRAARGLVWFWTILELGNGIGHAVMAPSRRGYFPGVATAPLLLLFAVWLAILHNRALLRSKPKLAKPETSRSSGFGSGTELTVTRLES